MNPAPVAQIDDPDDLRLELYADIRHRAAMPESRYFIAEGRLVVGRLIDSDYELHSLLVERGRESEFAAMLPPAVPIYSVSKTHIRELVGFDFHRGVIGCGYRKPIRPFSEFVAGGANFVSDSADSAGSSDRATVALAAICVTEPSNLGGMLRTAAAFGINQVLLSPSTHDPLARRLIRTSMAATFKHNFYRLDDPTNQLPTLAEQYNCRTIATTLAADATPIDSFDAHDQKLVLLMGSSEAFKRELYFCEQESDRPSGDVSIIGAGWGDSDVAIGVSAGSGRGSWRASPLAVRADRDGRWEIDRGSTPPLARLRVDRPGLVPGTLRPLGGGPLLAGLPPAAGDATIPDARLHSLGSTDPLQDLPGRCPSARRDRTAPGGAGDRGAHYQ